MEPAEWRETEAEALREAATHNLRSYLAHVAQHAQGGLTSDADGLLLFAGGHNFPGTYTNGLMRATATLPASVCLERAREFFGPLRRGYVVWARLDADQDLVAQCRTEDLVERPPPEGNAVLARAEPVEERPLPDGCELVDVVEEADRLAYLQLVLAANGLGGMDPAVGERMLFSLDSTRGPHSRIVLARYHGVVAAGAMSFQTPDGIGGTHWVATVDQARGRGLGRAVFARTVNGSFADGARCVTLLSSGKGLPLWLSTGFREVGRYARFLAKPPAA